MFFLSLLVVIVFVWLIFNHPFKGSENQKDRYSDYFECVAKIVDSKKERQNQM